MTDTINALVQADHSKNLNTSRILILVSTFSAKKSSSSEIINFSHLAKIDFLLRYPTVLRKALLIKGKSLRGLVIEKYEEKNIESEMIRFAFGPWDNGYREFIRMLSSKGLVEFGYDRSGSGISCTDLGQEVCERFIKQELFTPFFDRCKIIKSRLSYSERNLNELIYQSHPQIITLKSEENITI